MEKSLKIKSLFSKILFDKKIHHFANILFFQYKKWKKPGAKCKCCRKNHILL
jgi:hypothetical protein